MPAYHYHSGSCRYIWARYLIQSLLTILVENRTKKNFYVQGAFYGIFVCGIRNLRVLFGPLPVFLCQTQVALTKMVLWFSIVIIVTVTITKFMFICVWKSMRTMNDNLMVRIAINQALLSSIVIGLLKFRPHVSSVFTKIFLYNIVPLAFYFT